MGCFPLLWDTGLWGFIIIPKQLHQIRSMIQSKQIQTLDDYILEFGHNLFTIKIYLFLMSRILEFCSRFLTSVLKLLLHLDAVFFPYPDLTCRNGCYILYLQKWAPTSLWKFFTASFPGSERIVYAYHSTTS